MILIYKYNKVNKNLLILRFNIFLHKKLVEIINLIVLFIYRFLMKIFN